MMHTTVGSFICSVVIVGFSAVASGQQDVVVDPTHHKLEFENNCVRVVRAKFGPGEKSAGLFDTTRAVIVELTGSERFKVTFPDGKSVVAPGQPAGGVSWHPAGRIQPENIGTKPVEYLVIEPKGCD
jgi:hypothetical protein